MIKAILLAAGQSKRLKSENKLIKKFKNKALINHSLQALVKSKIDKIIIVLGYQNKEVRKVIKGPWPGDRSGSRGTHSSGCRPTSSPTRPRPTPRRRGTGTRRAASRQSR